MAPLATACPKPPPREKKPPRRLQSKTPIKRSEKPVAKVNVKALAKRRTKQQKHYASKEYRAARKLAVERSGGQCEAVHVVDHACRITRTMIPGDAITGGDTRGFLAARCPVREPLDFHETDYGSELGIIREIQGCMLCKADHAYIERTRHPTRRNGR